MISIQRSVLHMVAMVALKIQAAMPTNATATKACSIAEANDSATPRRQVSWLATT